MKSQGSLNGFVCVCRNTPAVVSLVSSYGPAQPIPVFRGLCKIVKYINYDFTEILKSDSAQLRLFRSLNAWQPKNIFPSIQKVFI